MFYLMGVVGRLDWKGFGVEFDLGEDLCGVWAFPKIILSVGKGWILLLECREGCADEI